MSALEKATLLVDGAAAFEEILRCIEQARRSILINMFIWRGDCIGTRIARAVLQAAERGVQVEISVDRVGMILERCEESGCSFFHTDPGIGEQIKIRTLEIWYPKNRSRAETVCTCRELADRLLSHPNITVDKDRQKNDHSKYYIIDGEILIFGGVNIEDKEGGSDCVGRVYQDYMLKLEGEEHVRAFLDKLERNQNTAAAYCFRMNNKTVSPAVFEMQDRFLAIINEAQQELVIVMAYFAPVPEICRAIVRAWERGVHIRILIPENPNFQNHSNRRTMRLLMKRSRDGIQVMFSQKMIHTKLIYNEKTVMFGSCNITNRAFTTLGELDVELKNEDIPVIRHLKASVAENFALAQPVKEYSGIRYSPLAAWIEGCCN